uniref:MAPKKK protein n=1 Tax=Volvariella volvacea TaxID=36659 RepID=I6LZP0_9AGAR|nr:MAPKKK protein [Volvariella volvacea]
MVRPPSQSQVFDPYVQFIKRYRNPNQYEIDDPRDDPDSHYYRYIEGVDGSDDDDLGRGSISGGDNMDRLAAYKSDSETTFPFTQVNQDRLEWSSMLSSVLSGDVLKSERARIQIVLENAAQEQNNVRLNIWLGIRAKFHGWTEEEERKRLEERRLRNVDPVINEILKFRIPDLPVHKPDEVTGYALQHVGSLLNRLEAVQSLYPSLKAFSIDKPMASQAAFQERCDALETWSTIVTSLRHQITLLRRWTNSETLDVTQPNTSAEVPIPTYAHSGPGTELTDGSSFVERILKEESMQRTFEKGFLGTVYSFIGSAREAQVSSISMFKEMNLPTFERELVPLISFPTNLAQAALRLRLEYVRKVEEPDTRDFILVDQMIDDLKVSIGLACTLKRQYEAFLAPDPHGNWNVPNCIKNDYDSTILEALVIFFKLIHLKLKSGHKGIYFKETDVLEAQWATYNDVSLTAAGGSCVVAEHLCSLTNKLIVRVINYLENQIRVPDGENMSDFIQAQRQRYLRKPADDKPQRKMTDQQIVGWYAKVLESVRLRYRKLQRFAKMLMQRFTNCIEYSIQNYPINDLLIALRDSGHVLIHSGSYVEEGVYIIASPSLADQPNVIRRLLTEAFHAEEHRNDDGNRLAGHGRPIRDHDDISQYILILTPRSPFLSLTSTIFYDLPKIDFDLKDDRCLIVADGPQRRLSMAKQAFLHALKFKDDEGKLHDRFGPLEATNEFQAHLPIVNRELAKITRAMNRLAESIVESVTRVHSFLRRINGCQELLANWFVFASEHGLHAQKYIDRQSIQKFNRMLINTAISWVTFIADDCDPQDRRTFKWAVHALEFTEARTKGNVILHIPEDDFRKLGVKVSRCMGLLLEHFDVLGARSSVEARRLREKQEEMMKLRPKDLKDTADEELNTPLSCEHTGFIDARARLYWSKVSDALREVEESRIDVGMRHHMMGRVLDTEKPEDRSLVFLASSSSNISIRWQQGKFIGAGAFGLVYMAVNLDTGSLMAVKEIKFQELSGLPNLYTQIKDELSVMEMLHHPNVVEYYGIEVHRDKVYIFEEYCPGGSLAALLENGRIEDEGIIQVYTLQMLEGLAYLHSRGIVHRDVKPDNLLLDANGVLKFVDFGAAKILAKNQRSIQRSRRGANDITVPNGAPGVNGPGVGHSLTGTPMYMSPEVIKNDKRGRHGAMDIWSLGCVVLEFATGKKPWSNLDNEWAIMFHIGVATQHPPLPEAGQLSPLGIDFIKKCLTIDPMSRPTALELMKHPWMVQFREAFMTNYPEEDGGIDGTPISRQAQILHQVESEALNRVTGNAQSPPVPTPPPLPAAPMINHVQSKDPFSDDDSDLEDDITESLNDEGEEEGEEKPGTESDDEKDDSSDYTDSESDSSYSDDSSEPSTDDEFSSSESV